MDDSILADPDFRNIGNADLISKRETRQVPIPPGGMLSDYIPFYLTPWSPMLYNIRTGYQGIRQVPMPEIAILVTSLHEVMGRNPDVPSKPRRSDGVWS